MADLSSSGQEPLLSRATSPTISQYSSISKSDGTPENNTGGVLLDCFPENDFIPEASALGRNIRWSSAVWRGRWKNRSR
jgi:hypothetical protein